MLEDYQKVKGDEMLLTKSKVKYFIRDEDKAVKEYEKVAFGEYDTQIKVLFHRLANDERNHRSLLKELLLKIGKEERLKKQVF